MNKPLLRNVLLPVILAGVFILLDLIADRLVGASRGPDLTHFILGASVLLISSFVLNRAVETHRRAEAVLGQARDEMETRVQERTAELERTNAQLQAEIAERRRIEQALRTSEETARALMNASSESAVLVDTQGIILAANETVAQSMGVTVERLVGSCLFDFFSPEVAGRRRTALNVVLGSGRPLHFIDERDGRTFDNHVYPVFDADGRVIRLAAFGQDITERMQAEEVLRQMNQRLALTQAAAGAGSWDWDIPAGHLEWSAKMFELFGLDERTTPASVDAWRSVLHPADRETAEQRIAVALETHSELVNEYRVIWPDGQIHWIHALGRGSYDEQNRPIRMSGICLDVTDRLRAEEALRTSEEKYRLLFQNMAEGFALYELLYDEQGRPADWRILEVNAAYTRHTGIAGERIVGRCMSELFPEAIPEYLPRFASVVATQSHLAFDTYAKAVGRHQHVVTFPAGGHRFASTIEDVTERRQAETALRKERDRAESYLNIAGVIIVTLDVDEKVTLINAKGCEVLGCSEGEIVGANWFDTFIPDRMRDEGRAVFVRVLTGHIPFTERVENPVLTCDGEERLIAWHNIALRDEAGYMIGTLSSGEDITDRKRAEEALRASEEKFSTVFHFSPDAIGIVRTVDDTFLDVNEAFTKMLGYSRSEAVGSTWTALNVVPTAGEGAAISELFLEKGQVVDHEVSLPTTHGDVATVLLSLIPIAVSGDPCILAIAHDITRRKRSEAALRETQAELALRIQEQTALEERQRLARELHDSVSQALYGISLGVNTALTLLDTDRTKVLEALDYALSLTHGGLAEMRALIFELRPESLEMEGLAVALTKQVDALRARHGIDVELSLCDEPDVPLAVKEVLYRIALEALQNAIKHARSDRLDVRLTREPDGLTLEVCDNGKGFDPLALYPGHLGLRSMRERATNVGGTLNVVSAPDCGTQIRARVPLLATETFEVCETSKV